MSHGLARIRATILATMAQPASAPDPWWSVAGAFEPIRVEGPERLSDLYDGLVETLLSQGIPGLDPVECGVSALTPSGCPVQLDGLRVWAVPDPETGEWRRVGRGTEAVYQPLPLSEAVAMLESVAPEGSQPSTIGLLRNGERWFASVKVGVSARTGETYFLCATGGHGGTAVVQWYLTAVNPVCENTVAIGLSSAVARFRRKHTQALADDVRQGENGSLGEALSFAIQEVIGVREADLAILDAKDVDPQKAAAAIVAAVNGDPADKSARGQTRHQGLVDAILEAMDACPMRPGLSTARQVYEGLTYATSRQGFGTRLSGADILDSLLGGRTAEIQEQALQVLIKVATDDGMDFVPVDLAAAATDDPAGVGAALLADILEGM